MDIQLGVSHVIYSAVRYRYSSLIFKILIFAHVNILHITAEYLNINHEYLFFSV